LIYKVKANVLSWLRRNIAVVGIILTFCVYTIPEYIRVIEVPGSPAGWAMVDIWLKSAECARESVKAKTNLSISAWYSILVMVLHYRNYQICEVFGRSFR
jgi:hypothetical protein